MNSNTEAKLTLNGKNRGLDSFLYLRSNVTNTHGVEKDAKRCIRQANGTFIPLYPIWKNKNILRRTKL